MVNQIFFFKLFFILIILITTVISGAYPLSKKIRFTERCDFPIGDALSAGVFLGAGLLHMLSDATVRFSQLGYQYPFACLLAGTVFLLLLFFEHIGREVYQHKKDAAFAVLAMIMLSVHSFLAGAALGVSMSLAVTIIIALAILAHKWAAGFALSVQLSKSELSAKLSIILFAIFASMIPLGVIFGQVMLLTVPYHQLIEPVFMALSAGTFLYLGTLHGLNRAVMVAKCCDLKQFNFVILGFAIMAVAAIWV
jgi:solute carrier family 39 (zinc transporter), member 1/2/3